MNPQKNENAQAPKLIKVRLFRNHEHAGVKYKPGPEGIEIEVSQRAAERMKQFGVLDRPETKPADAPSAPPT